MSHPVQIRKLDDDSSSNLLSSSIQSWADAFSRSVEYQGLVVNHFQPTSQPPTVNEYESDVESILSYDGRRPPIQIIPSERQALLASDELEAPSKELSFGSSTYAQTIFNSVNILMGIAILSVPYAFKMVGWIPGVVMLLTCSLLTSYTAKTLAKCMDSGPDMFTYGDVGEKAFGKKGKYFISAIFMTELLAACVALLVLAGDSLKALFPDNNIVILKIIIFVVVTPTTWFRSTKWLSIGSLIGVFSLFFLGFSIVINGFMRKEQPGSIVEPMDTRLWPTSFSEFCMSFGLLMAGFTGHAVFPSIYRDMKDPERYPSVVKVTYSIVVGFTVIIAVSGYLMFGDSTQEEITKNLAKVSGNKTFNQITVWLITLNPISKFPLSMNPLSLNLKQIISFVSSSRYGGTSCAIFEHIIISTFCSVIILLSAIYFPGFDRLMALLGAFFSVVVSVLFPTLCYLKLYAKILTKRELFINRLIVWFSVIFIILGTYGSFTG